MEFNINIVLVIFNNEEYVLLDKKTNELPFRYLNVEDDIQDSIKELLKRYIDANLYWLLEYAIVDNGYFRYKDNEFIFVFSCVVNAKVKFFEERIKRVSNEEIWRKDSEISERDIRCLSRIG